jgi:hypothetical protein
VYVTTVGFAGALLRRRRSVAGGWSSCLREEMPQLLLLFVFFVLIHLALFPQVLDRFFAGPYLVATLGLFALLSQLSVDFVLDERACSRSVTG